MPNGTTIPILKDAIFDDEANNVIFRAREVTADLAVLPNMGIGDYYIQGLRTSVNGPGAQNNGLGWALVVVYKNSMGMDLRNVSVFSGSLQNGGSTTITGFFTPKSGTVSARVFAEAIEGDSNIGGESFF